jgi:hypothetical protein
MFLVRLWISGAFVRRSECLPYLMQEAHPSTIRLYCRSDRWLSSVLPAKRELLERRSRRTVTPRGRINACYANPRNCFMRLSIIAAVRRQLCMG